ncbi:hypothetical protein A0J61_11355 [Choanephora cucurbitarum]|uniref:Uncharacterized protein n=1 Tax=Choanephora cucurbitarum TaxID=101091 RepID=A0A1C7MUP5_9FUNG|nr:hypothetical protein A0J61_11355 [Choanephora cucurbitarum]
MKQKRHVLIASILQPSGSSSSQYHLIPRIKLSTLEDWRYEVFTHGQLYVAFSRATSWKNITVLFSEDKEEETTRNIVCPELLIN